MSVLIYFTVIAFYITTTSAPKTTIPQRERISILKRELLKDVKGDHDFRSSYLNYGDVYETYEMVDRDFVVNPIYPDEDDKKKWKIKRMTNRTAPKTTKKTKGRSAKREGLRSVLKLQKIEKKRQHLLNPLDVFYRRVVGVEFKDTETKWVHCQDMITPYLTGMKKDASELKRVSMNNRLLVRFLHLLNTDTSNFSKDEVMAVLYEISMLNLRLFQWDVMPIRVLLNTLIKKGTHTFRNLKRGIRERFDVWRLSLYNYTKILQATRIIRPPCTVTSQYSGSTKSEKVSRFKDWITTLKPLCDHSNPGEDEDCR